MRGFWQFRLSVGRLKWKMARQCRVTYLQNEIQKMIIANPSLLINLLSELSKSKSPWFTLRVLEILMSLPDSALYKDDTVNVYFSTEAFPLITSVRDRLSVCHMAIITCFDPS
jgi:hypothetical protein